MPIPKLDAILCSYASQKFPSLPLDYKWKFDVAMASKSFNMPINGKNWYKKTCALKRGIANKWNSSPEQRANLAEYAVRVWGGIKRNNAATIQSYVQVISQGQLPPTLKGIASWSKVAAFSNPDVHAIFDARVSFSLNAIQMLHGEGEWWWFPHLAGQNKLLNEIWPSLKKQENQKKWSHIEPQKVYSTYIDLLNNVAQQLKINIDDVEMLLFSKAEELALRVKMM